MNNQAEIIEDDDEELDTEMESETEVSLNKYTFGRCPKNKTPPVSF